VHRIVWRVGGRARARAGYSRDPKS
jgi:hypothetical protein